MKNEKHPVEISQTDGEVTIRITGTAYRNLARIARTVNALPGVSAEKKATPASIAEQLATFGHLGLVDDAEEAAKALESIMSGFGATLAYALPYAAFGE